jgi:cytochrome P450
MVDLLAPDFVADPHPHLHTLRARDPVHWSERHRAWVLTRHADVQQAFRSRSLSSEHTGVGDQRDPIVRVLRNWMEFRDPPDHDRLRRLVQRTFTPRVIEGLRPRIATLVDGMLDALRENGGGDFMQHFAYPLPATVIAEMMGVPVSDQKSFRGWSEDIKGVIFGGLEDAERFERARHGFLQLESYFRVLIERYRRSPGDNLLSALSDSGSELNDDEIVGTSVLLLFGGHETTSNLLANGLVALRDFPAVRRALEANPEAVPRAVEEFLRWDGPTMLMVRLCREKIEFGGTTLRAGDRVFLHQTAANRDPARFDHPDAVDLERANLSSHLAFGFGTHYCLGAPLARLEAAIAFDRIARSHSDLLVGGGRLEWRRTMLARNLGSLPVSFGSRAAA